MKTPNVYKSLLLAGGLLLTCYTGEPRHNEGREVVRTLHEISKPQANRAAKPVLILSKLAEKLFPVLKNLNLM